MASIDWTDYVDLTPYDEDATTLFNDAIEYGRVVLPEWVPAVGNIEVVAIESAATAASSVVSAANRVPGAVVETLLKLFDIERSDGTKATGTVQVTTTDSAGYTIPADTPFAYFPTDGTQPLTYILDEAIVVSPSSSTGTGTVTAQLVGVAHNGPAVNSRLQVLATMPYVQSATFTIAPSGGAGAEDDDTFFGRAVTTLASYTSALVTANQIQSYVLLNHTAAYRCKVYSQRRASDRDTTDAAYSTHDGHVLIVVGGENVDIADTSDVALSAGELATIEDDVSDRTVMSLEVEVVSAQLVSVDVTAEFNVLSGYVASEVETAVTAALQAYLSPNTWDWDEVVRINEIIALIDGVAGVEYVASASIDLNGGETEATDDGTNISFHQLGTLPVADDITLTSTQV